MSPASAIQESGTSITSWPNCFTEENYFLNEDEEFLLSAAEKYGAKGAKQAQALVDEVSGLLRAEILPMRIWM